MRTLTLIGLGWAALACAQDNGPQRITMPFRDPSMPRKLEVNLMLGGVTVRGYNGNEVVVEYTGSASLLPGRRNSTPPPGMHRIGGAGGLEVTEDNNVVHVSNRFGPRMTDLVIQVPVQTSVSVKTMTGGNLVVENVSGEVEAQNMNGQVTVNNVSGSVVAHSMNGKVVATLDKVDPGKNMSFSTMNGEVDVTLPADTKANLKMRTDNGDIFTDFDVKTEAASAPTVSEEKGKNGKTRRRVRVDGTVNGTINGGGPEIQFTTFNGRILIHKK